MITGTNPGIMAYLSHLATWILTWVLVLTGFYLAGKLAGVVLDKLYEFFVLKNPTL